MNEKWIMFDGTNYPEDFGEYLVLVVNRLERGGRPFVYMAYCGELLWREDLGRVFYTVEGDWGGLPFYPEEVIAWRPLPGFDDIDWETATAKYWETWDEFDKTWKEKE